MSTKPEFVVYDRDGQRVAIVDVRTRRGTSTDWATQLRRNLQEFEPVVWRAPFFLIATPDRIYLWKDAWREPGPESKPLPPDLELDGVEVFGPYLEKTRSKLEDLSGPGFELVVMSWLQDLVHPIPGLYPHAALDARDLGEAVRDGRIDFPAAA
jgi:hypothetical protein